MPDIVLKFNNTGSTATCAKCGKPDDIPVGMWPFIEGSYNPVCMPCARFHTMECPEWHAALDQCPCPDPRSQREMTADDLPSWLVGDGPVDVRPPSAEIEMTQTDMRNLPELGLLRLRLGDIQGAVLLEAPSRPDYHGVALTIATDAHISRMAPYVPALRRAADWLEEMVARDRADSPF
jgi:hypothetical protein